MNANDAIYLERWIHHREADAFREIVTRYAGMVYGAARRVLGGADGAEDIAQECFQTLATAEKAPSTYLGPWLHRVATNLALKRVRTETRRRSREAHYATAQPNTAEAKWDDIYEYVDEAIAALPDDLREPIVAHYLEGYSQTEIAIALGIPRQTLTNRIHKGIGEVRERLRKRGIEVGGVALGALLASHLAEAVVVPASVLASTGKIALAGRASGALTSWFAGMAFGPKVSLLVGFVLCAGLAWFVTSNHDERAPSLRSAASMSEVDATASTPFGVSDGAVADPPSGTISGGMVASGTTDTEPASSSPVSNGGYGTISGTVRFRGQALPGMSVTIRPGIGEERTAVETAVSGVYVFKEIPVGDYQIVGALSPSVEFDLPQLYRRVNVTVEPGITTKVDFDFPAPGGYLECTITYEGRRVADTGLGKCTLRVTEASGTEVYAGGAGISRNGRFAFEEVPGGTAKLEVWVAAEVDGANRNLRHSAEFEMPANGNVFRQVELEKQADTLVVHLQGLTEQFDGSVSLLTGNVQLDDVSVEFLKSLAPVMVTARNLRGQKVLQFGRVEPGDYTVLMMAIDRQYMEKPEEEQLELGLFAVEPLHVVEGETYEFTFSLE
jgi:RNA polymerase sigma factor (sigma-70 family)